MSPTLIFLLPVIGMNLFAVGIFTGKLTRIFLRFRPAMMSEGATLFTLWLSAVGVIVFDLLLLLVSCSGGKLYT